MLNLDAVVEWEELSGFVCRRCDNVWDVGVPNGDRTPGHRVRSLKATERAVTMVRCYCSFHTWVCHVVSSLDVFPTVYWWRFTSLGYNDLFGKESSTFRKNCGGFFFRTKQSNESFNSFFVAYVGRDGIVSIATRYGLDGPRIESRWGSRFSAPVQTGPGAHPSSYAVDTGSFPGIKRPGRGVNHPPPYSAEVLACTLFQELFRFFCTG
jgi:hypothetical protein